MLQGTSTVEEATAELDYLLTSPAFARAPRTARLLEYLCRRSLAGESAQITEYNIAVEVLGRPRSFVPADDAIARVEVHRLRKKLRDFYENEGRMRPVQIQIPTGSYVPSFLSAAPSEGLSTKFEVAQVKVTPETKAPPRQPFWSQRWIFAGLGFLALAAALFAFRGRTPSRTFSETDAQRLVAGDLVPEEVLPGGGADVRISSGRTQPLRDKNGQLWGADQYFTGGDTYSVPSRIIRRTNDPDLYVSGRAGSFTYDIPLKPGNYELRLHFAEVFHHEDDTHSGAEGARTFHVVLNGKRVLSDFDVYADAGGSDIADIRVFKDIAPNREGQLHLRFIGVADKAMVSAIEIRPARPHRINPIRITAGRRAVRDSRGLIWWPDNFRLGGHIAPATVPVQSRDPQLYLSEIYGNIDYAVPVADGTYNLSLYLAETYWGPENAGGGGAGTRVFDILCNGLVLERGVDVFSRVGSSRPLTLRYGGLTPNAQGKLNISLVPVKNYASVYALEVEDAGR